MTVRRGGFRENQELGFEHKFRKPVETGVVAGYTGPEFRAAVWIQKQKRSFQNCET